MEAAVSKSISSYPAWPPEDVLPAVSHSSMSDYLTCPRRWAYEKAGGLCPPRLARDLYIAKSLMPTAALVGSVTDTIISDAFRNYHDTGERPDNYLGDIVSAVRRHFRARSKFSVEWVSAIRKGDSIPNPERIAPLAGILREPRISPDEAEALVARSTLAIFNFLESPLYGRIMAVEHRRVLTQPRGNIGKQRAAIPWYWVADDLAVYASYDLVVRAPDTWLVVDWKTGRRETSEERARSQLNHYAGFVMQKFAVAADDIELVAAWIGEGTETSTFEAAAGFVDGRAPHWRQWRDKVRLDMADVGQDRALLDERFPMASDASTCRFCKYHFCPGYHRHKTNAVNAEMAAW